MSDRTPVNTGQPLLDRYDARMVQELAIGVDDDAEVLERYGFTGAEAEKLLSDPLLRVEVASLTQELRRAGMTARIKARLVAEDLIGLIATKTADGTRSVAEMLDVLKVLAKIGDLEPREGGGRLAGTIVRVDLNFAALGLPASFGPPQPGASTVTVLDIPVTDVAFTEVAGTMPVTFLGWEVDDLQWVAPDAPP